MSFIFFGTIAVGSYLIYKIINSEINFTMTALKAHNWITDNKRKEEDPNK